MTPFTRPHQHINTHLRHYSSTSPKFQTRTPTPHCLCQIVMGQLQIPLNVVIYHSNFEIQLAHLGFKNNPNSCNRPTF